MASGWPSGPEAVHVVIGEAVDRAVAQGEFVQAADVVIGGILMAAIGLDALGRAAVTQM